MRRFLILLLVLMSCHISSVAAHATTPVTLIAHTIVDRNILRAGETVNMRHFLRVKTASGFAYPSDSELPSVLVIEHESKESRYELQLRWDARGSSVTSWRIPENARTGSYMISLRRKQRRPVSAYDGHEYGMEILSGSFRVEKFGEPSMTAIIQPPALPLVNVKEVPVNVFAFYRSGGGVDNLDVKLTGRVQAKKINFSEYEDFVFSGNEAKQAGRDEIPVREFKLDADGSGRSSITGFAPVTAPWEMLASLEFKETDGKTQTICRKIPLWPSRLLIGIKPDPLFLTKKRLKSLVVVTDLKGRPEPGKDVNVEVFEKRSGNSLPADRPAVSLCRGKTDTHGLLVCDSASPVEGYAILRAAVSDNEGNRAVTDTEVFIADKNVPAVADANQSVTPVIAHVADGQHAHELKVDVAVDKDFYKAGEKAKARIMVRKVNGAPPPKGSEVVVAAIDEGSLSSLPNESWDILGAMVAGRSQRMDDLTPQLQESAGIRLARVPRTPLLLWRPRVALNQKGEATVEVPVNVSAENFRLIAAATGGPGLFGTGQAVVRTSRDIDIRPRIPGVVREGDMFRAVFSVRNVSGRAMEVELSVSIDSKEKQKPDSKSVVLKPGESREVGWNVIVPNSVDRLQYEVTARERGGAAIDNLKIQQRVTEAIPSHIIQSMLTQIDGSYNMELDKPHDALSAAGSIVVSLKPKLADAMIGVISYMKQYPYVNMEQKVSRAVALGDKALWKKLIAEIPSYLDADGLVKYFPSMQEGSDALTSYIISISDEAGLTISAAAMDKMEKGLKKFIDSGANGNPEDSLTRKIAAMEALARSGRAEARMPAAITVEPNRWPPPAVLSWANVLLRLPDLPDHDRLLKETEQIMRARFSSAVSSDFDAVKSITTSLHFAGWKHDIPRMVRAALDRQSQGRWALPAANAWGVLAMEKFSRMFEPAGVSGTTTVGINGNEFSQQWSKFPGGKILHFPWNKEKETLLLRQSGKGRPWAAVQSSAAIPLSGPVSQGFKISRILIPVECKTAGLWSEGDVVKVRLEFESQADTGWVAVSDPIPAGAEITGAGQEGDSGGLKPVSEDRSSEAFRAYYEFVPKGKWAVEYTMRLANSGIFHLPPTHVEAIYAPDVFGELPNDAINIVE